MEQRHGTLFCPNIYQSFGEKARLGIKDLRTSSLRARKCLLTLTSNSSMQFRPLLEKIQKEREIYHRYYCNFILQDKSNLLHVLSVSIVYFCNHLQCTHTCFLALVETCLVLCVFKNVICRFLDGKDFRSSLSISNSSSSILHSLSPNLPSRLPFPVLTRRCAHSDCISLW